MNLDRAFDDGGRFENEHYAGVLRVRQIAELVVTSGQIVACDSLVWYMAEPYERKVAAGRYPILLTLAEYPDGDQRVAFARIRFRQGRPVTWEMATTASQDLAILKEDEIFGYPVDSGTGCFMDLDALRALEAMPDSDSVDFSEAVIERMGEHQVNTWTWLDVTLGQPAGANQIAFSTGHGDGYYASYWGLDSSADAICLVTDFGII